MPTPEALAVVDERFGPFDESRTWGETDDSVENRRRFWEKRRQSWAAELDRFAAQRGAAADDDDLEPGELRSCPFCGGEPAVGFADDGGSFIECSHCHASTALYYDRCENLIPNWNNRVKQGAPPQTGGGDAPHPIDGWTPEIMAEEARRFDEGLPAALDQFEKATAGGDAGLTIRNPAPDGTPPSMPTGRNATITIQRGQPGGGDAGERDYLERAHAVLRDGHRRHLREPPGGKNLTLCEVDAIAAALRSFHREAAEAMREAAALAIDAAADPGGTYDHVTLLHLAEDVRALPIPGKTDAE